jgi:hypothetical protein
MVEKNVQLPLEAKPVARASQSTQALHGSLQSVTPALF